MEVPQIVNLDIGLIDPPEEPDRLEVDPDIIKRLLASIVQNTLLQPILVRPRGARFEVVAGDRRFKAHQLGNINRIPAIVREMSDCEAALLRATENLEREDLTPLEEARTYVRLYEKHNMSWEEIGARFGKSPAMIKRRSDIIRMDETLQQALHKKQISVGVAEELWRISDKTALAYYLSFALDGGCTVAIARQWAQDYEKELRQSQRADSGGAHFRHPSEQVPIYVACDLCREAMKVGEETVLRCCPACTGAISEVIKSHQG